MSTTDPEKGVTYSRWLRETVNDREMNVRSTPFSWWYQLCAPPEPAAGASLYQRERVRHGRVGSLAILVFMLFLLGLLVLALVNRVMMVQAIATLVGLVGCVGILYLNRKGFIELAGLSVLVLVYVGGTISMLNYPTGLTVESSYHLYFSILPEMLAIAFFSANSLPVVFGISVVQIWVIVAFGPHDATIANMLHKAPLQIYLPIYLLLIVTTVTLYFWVRSAEDALRRADRAEEIATYQQREKERQQKEVEQKRRLDAGIQQILQTHIAVANGDLNIRAPLTQDHALWQVAVSLNTLIARLQNLSQVERELRLLQQKEDERATGNHLAVKQTEREPRPQPRPEDKFATGYQPAYRPERSTDHRQPRYDPNQATNLKSDPNRATNLKSDTAPRQKSV
jgi:hypothetical protein